MNIPIAFIFGGIGTMEMAVIAILAVVLFGSRLPEVARSLGGSYNEFRKGLNDIQDSIKQELDATTKEVKKISQEVDLEDTYDPPPTKVFSPPLEDDV